MKRLLDVAILITLALSMGACASAASPAPIPTVALDTQAAAPSASAVTASVEVVPAQVAHLSFVISAPVKAILVHEGDEVKAGEPLITLDAPDLEYGQAAAEQAYKSAQVDNFIQSQGRRKFILDRFVWVGGTPEQRRQAEARVDSTQAAYEAASARYAQATLTAPFDGTVASIGVSLGEMVQPGEVVLVMGSLDRMQIETTDLSERDIARVRLGQTAHVQLKAVSDELMGRVIAIDPRAGKSEDGDTIFKITIALDQQPTTLRWGMTGDVGIDSNSTQ